MPGNGTNSAQKVRVDAFHTSLAVPFERPADELQALHDNIRDDWKAPRAMDEGTNADDVDPIGFPSAHPPDEMLDYDPAMTRKGVG